MLNRSWILALGIATLGGLCWSDGAVAKISSNGTSLNGTSLNGTSLNGSLTPNAVTLRGVRLVLPDGTELLFR